MNNKSKPQACSVFGIRGAKVMPFLLKTIGIKATLDFTLHPSPFRRNPLCLSAFQEVKGGTNPSPTLHPPFTLYPPVFICNCILTFSFLSQESKILPCQGQHFAPIRHKTKRRDRKKYTTGRLFFSSKRISAFSEGTDRKP